jgi:hypothetical protein
VTAAERNAKLYPVFAVVAAVVAGIHAVGALPVGVFYDDAFYVVLGKALANGSGYHYLNVPGEPAATHYPPGYPALLAVLWRIMPSFPENIALFRLVNALLLGPLALLSYLFARRRLHFTPPLAGAIAIVGTAAIPVLLLSSNVLSEILFLVLLLPLLLAAERDVERGGAARSVALGVAAGLLCLVRSHGIVLIPAIAGTYLMNRRRREAALSAAASVLVLLPWLVWVQRHGADVPVALRGGYGSYGAWFLEALRTGGAGFFAETAWQNVVTIGAIFARVLGIADHPILGAIALLAGLFLCAAGCVMFWRRARVTLLFIACYMLLVVIWPFSPLRFVMGVWPLIVLLLAAGTGMLWRYETGRWGPVVRPAGIVAAAIVVLGALSFNVRGYRNAWWDSVGRSLGPRIQLQLQWVVEHTDPSDVIAAEDEGAVYLYTGRRAVPVATFTATQYLRARSPVENAAAMAEILDAFKPDYLIAWAYPTQAASAILSSPPRPRLVTVDTIPGGRVFRRGEK